MTFDDFLNGQKKLVQNTAAVEYHLLKKFVLYHIDAFLKALAESKTIEKLYEEVVGIILKIKDR